jgi:hypothetical protein
MVGSGEGIMGLIDSYPPGFAAASPTRLEQIEQICVTWRWRLRRHPERLSQIHGDFHPFNVLFQEGDEFTLLDRSRSPWGEPADDVSCMAINYLFFSLQRDGTFREPFTTLWTTFWDTYLRASGDRAVLSSVQPFFVWRALVLANPLWYEVPPPVRATLFELIRQMLVSTLFDPDAVARSFAPEAATRSAAVAIPA